MNLKLTLPSRLKILKAINANASELSLLDMIVANELVDMLCIRSTDIERCEINYDGETMTWNQEKDLQSPLEVNFNDVQVTFLRNFKTQ